MSDTTSRALQLLGLLQSRPVWSGRELADRLGVTTRSVRRDIDRLRELGYPVDAERGVDGGYRLGAGRALPPLLVDGEEAVAMAVCLRLAATGTVAGLGEAALRVLAKLDQLLPAKLRAQVAAVQDTTMTLGGGREQIDPNLLVTLARAARESAVVNIDYVDRGGNQTERRLEPYRLAATRNRWYLVAFDLDRDGWRTLRLDRIGAVHVTTFRFRPREAPDFEAFVEQSLTQAPYPHQVTVQFALGIDAVLERIPATVGTFTRVSARRTRVQIGGDDLDKMVAYMMLSGLEFTVVDSPQFQKALRRHANLARRCAAG